MHVENGRSTIIYKFRNKNAINKAAKALRSLFRREDARDAGARC